MSIHGDIFSEVDWYLQKENCRVEQGEITKTDVESMFKNLSWET